MCVYWSYFNKCVFYKWFTVIFVSGFLLVDSKHQTSEQQTYNIYVAGIAGLLCYVFVPGTCKMANFTQELAKTYTSKNIHTPKLQQHTHNTLLLHFKISGLRGIVWHGYMKEEMMTYIISIWLMILLTYAVFKVNIFAHFTWVNCSLKMNHFLIISLPIVGARKK